MPQGTDKGKLYQFRNCYLLRDHAIYKDDLWVRDGKIVNPEKLFFDENALADVQIDCNGAIVSAGFIDLQINGGFGVDFSDVSNNVAIEEGVRTVAKGILAHGVTSFCPSLITSPASTYHQILPFIKKCPGSKDGAGVLGTHLEGPFISESKKGAHHADHISTFTNGLADVTDTYGTLRDVAIVTLAPELEKSDEVISGLTRHGITVSLGHSVGSLVEGERAVCQGARLITHLFNAMLPFHHRDPHLVGLLTSDRLPKNSPIYYGLIADGVHTHPAALRIAYRVHPQGLVLVTDAIQAMGLVAGKYVLGNQEIEISGQKSVLTGTETLSGSVSPMDFCVRTLLASTHCDKVFALESASLRAAQALGITDRKGTLAFDTDADFVLLTDDLHPLATYIAGDLAWQRSPIKHL